MYMYVLSLILLKAGRAYKMQSINVTCQFDAIISSPRFEFMNSIDYSCMPIDIILDNEVPCNTFDPRCFESGRPAACNTYFIILD